MKYFLFSKGVEQFNVNKESLGIGDDRAVYFAKSIGKHRLYRSGYPKPNDKDFELLTFDTLLEAQQEANNTNQTNNDNFEPREVV